MTVSKIRRRFDKFSRLYWDRALKCPPSVVIIPAGQKGQILNGCSDWGGYNGECLELRHLSHDVDDTFFNAILLNEMIHVELWPKGTDHRSKEYRQEIRRLSRRNALREVI